MKRLYKLLSLILTFCMFTIALVGYMPAKALSEAPQAAGEIFELPDIVDSAEAEKNGYVGRVKAQEKDLYTFVFSNEDGTSTMRVYSHPVKYVASDGLVRDISLDVKSKKGGGFVSADHEILTTFESKLTDGISLAYNDIEIELVPNLGLGKVPSARSDGKKVTYATSNTTSYVYELTYAGFKEDIVVKEYTGQTEYSSRFSQTVLPFTRNTARTIL